MIHDYSSEINRLAFEAANNGIDLPADDHAALARRIGELAAAREALQAAPLLLPPSRFDDPTELRHDLVDYLAHLHRGPATALQFDPGCLLASRFDVDQLVPELATADHQVRNAIVSALSGHLPPALDFNHSGEDLDELYERISTVGAAAANQIDRRGGTHSGVTACLTRASDARRLNADLRLALQYTQLAHETALAATAAGLMPLLRPDAPDRQPDRETTVTPAIPIRYQRARGHRPHHSQSTSGDHHPHWPAVSRNSPRPWRGG